MINIQEKSIDWIGMQKYASKIKGSFVTREVILDSVHAYGNPKNPSVRDCVGYMPGEVYSFGIVYVFDDGRESPVFHIPGWEANETSGFRSYKCQNNTYPPIHKDYGNGDYWGVDFNGKKLEGKNIRHFKFPFRDEVEIGLVEPYNETQVLNPGGDTLKIVVDIIGKLTIKTTNPSHVFPIQIFYKKGNNTPIEIYTTVDLTKSGWVLDVDNNEYVNNNFVFVPAANDKESTVKLTKTWNADLIIDDPNNSDSCRH
ncbi:hypothetical protein FACS1894195_5320 [Bacteroidia bacterium]|nr:hypothetical protein FACS1894195_5320 [Bacteroidia bacterium]